MDTLIIDGKVVQICPIALLEKIKYDSIKWNLEWLDTYRAIKIAVSAKAIPPQKP